MKNNIWNPQIIKENVLDIIKNKSCTSQMGATLIFNSAKTKATTTKPQKFLKYPVHPTVHKQMSDLKHYL